MTETERKAEEEKKVNYKDWGSAPSMVHYTVCLRCGNTRGFVHHGGFVWCTVCCGPYGSEI